jgi:hypothetical protein
MDFYHNDVKRGKHLASISSCKCDVNNFQQFPAMQIVAESIQFPVTSFALRSAAKNSPMYIDYQSLTSLWSMQFGRVAKIDIRLLMVLQLWKLDFGIFAFEQKMVQIL